MIGRCLGADNTPQGLAQYKDWIQRCMPSGGTFHTFGLAVVCWAIWKCRNRACFDKKNDKKLCWNHITCLCFYELLGRTLQRGAPRDAGGRCEGSSLLRVQSSVVARTGDAAASTDCSTGRPRRGVIEAGEQCLEECLKSFSYLLFACPKSASTFVLLSLASKSVFCNTLKLCSLCLQSGAWES